jgi:hypothetical protein
VLTRFTQAVGRCTRSDQDFAIVLLSGKRLVEHLLAKDHQALLHPELQAEIRFGLDNSRDRQADELHELVDEFLEHTENWKSAERGLQQDRDNATKKQDPAAQALSRSVASEVEYVYRLWRRDFDGALESARRVADALEGGRELKGYRGWWYYLAGDAAWLSFSASSKPDRKAAAHDLFRKAAACCMSISWLADISRLADDGKSASSGLTSYAVEGVVTWLKKTGLFGASFDQEIERVRTGLRSGQHGPFQRALESLGAMLGFESWCPKGQGVPDCIWGLRAHVAITHEAKPEQSHDGVLGKADIQQAAGHADWTRANEPRLADANIIAAIESPRQTLGKDAVAHAKDVFLFAPKALLELFGRIERTLREIRGCVVELDGEAARETILERLTAVHLLPDDVIRLCCAQAVVDMPNR